MKRPGAIERTLERIQEWRRICPDLTLRSTFIVGSLVKPKDFQMLLDFLEKAELDRVGCFKYSPSMAPKPTSCQIRSRKRFGKSVSIVSWNYSRKFLPADWLPKWVVSWM